MLELTESQAEEVELLDTLTLTDEQWRDLRKIGPACPKRFYTILPIDHNDCTCGYSDYVILVSRRKAAVLHYMIKEDQTEGLEQLFTYSKPSILWGSRWEKYYGDRLTLRVDGQGRFSMGSSFISYEQLRKLLALKQMSFDPSRGPMPVENNRSLVFQLAVGVRAGGDVKAKAGELRKVAEASGWDVEFEPKLAWGIGAE